MTEAPGASSLAGAARQMGIQSAFTSQTCFPSGMSPAVCLCHCYCLQTNQIQFTSCNNLTDNTVFCSNRGLLFYFIFYFCGAANGTQGLTHIKHVLYNMFCTLSSFKVCFKACKRSGPLALLDPEWPTFVCSVSIFFSQK